MNDDYGEQTGVSGALVILLVLAGIGFFMQSALIELTASQKSVNEHKPCSEHKDVNCDNPYYKELK